MFFHEDDYCQIQLLPLENWEYLILEADKINRFGIEHAAGTGFSDIYLRPPAPRKLSERQITVNDIEQILNKSELTRFDEISTGYGVSYRELCDNTTGYGGKAYVLLYDFKNDIVENIWMLIRGRDDTAKEKFGKALFELGQRHNLVLMDWSQSALTDLRHIDAINDYLNS